MQVDSRQIAQRAYGLWEQAGRPAGRDLEFWLLAENQLQAERQPAHDSPPATLAEFAPARSGLKTRAASPRVATPKLSGSRAASSRKRKS